MVDIAEIDRGRDVHLQRVDAGTAVDRCFRSLIDGGVIPGARRDDIDTPAAIDDIVARPRQDRIGGGRSRDGQRRRDGAAIKVFEIRDAHDVADRLVRTCGDGEIDSRDAAGNRQHQRVGSGATVDRGFRAAIGDAVIAGTGIDDIRTATAIDGVVADAAGNDVDTGRAGDRDAGDQLRGVDILEVRDRHEVADGLVGVGEIDGRGDPQQQRIGADATIDRELGAAIGHRIVARAGVDDVGAAAAIDAVGARPCGDDIDRGRARDQQRRGRDRGVEVFEIRHQHAVARGLVRTCGNREIDRGDAARRGKNQRIGTGSAVDRGLGPMIDDRIVAAIGVDDVGIANAVNGVVAEAAGDDVRARRTGDRNPRRQGRGVDVLEIRDVGRIARRLIGIAEIDGRCRLQQQRVGSGAAVQRGFSAVVGDRIIAAAGGDDIRSAATVDGIAARAGRDRIGENRTRDDQRCRERAGIQVLEIRHADTVAGGLIRAGGDGEVDRSQGRSGGNDQRIGSDIAIDRDFSAVVGYDVIAGTAIDDVGAATAIDGVVAGAGRDRVRCRRSVDGQGCRQCRRIDVLEIGDIGGIRRRLVGIGEIDGRRGPEDQRIGSGATIDRNFGAVVGDCVIAATRGDDVRTARAVDGVVAGTAGDDIRARRAGDRDRGGQRRRIHVLEVRNVGCVARGLIGVGKIDRRRGSHQQRVGADATVDRGFGAVIGDRVVTCAGVDNVDPASAIDDVVARARRNRVRRGRSGDRQSRR